MRLVVYEYLIDFKNVETVKIVIRVVLQLIAVDKALLFEVVGVKLFAYHCNT